ncbi:MAG: YqaE/Pmp3 family membrane protein [Chloroflexia bacterium]|nr:YqaE/Pmp3 family membrane protein [Chloroflexia bacterium]
MKITRLILTVIIPPIGVFLKRGLGWPFLISIVLTLLAYVPGLVYALVIVLGDEKKSGSV